MQTSQECSTACVGVLDGLERFLTGRLPQPGDFLARFGISAELLKNPGNRIPLKQLAALLEGAAEATGDEHFGAHYATQCRPSHLGLVWYIFKSSRTLREGLVELERLTPIQQSLSTVSYSTDGNIARVTYRVQDGGLALSRRQDAELTVAMTVEFFRLLLQTPSWTASVTHFSHPPPKKTIPLKGIFGPIINYCSEFDGFEFPSDLLDRELPDHDQVLLSILKGYAEETLRRLPAMANLADRVHDAILASLSSGGVDVDRIASRLAMSPRSLQRKLADEGLSFQQILEKARRTLSSRLILQSSLSLGEISHLLGYSNLPAFHRAFKRWFMQSPHEYRLSSRQHEALAAQ